MTNSMPTLALLSLLASPLFLGGQESSPIKGDTTKTKAEYSAVDVAEFVMNSLQNWSAYKVEGATWVTPKRRNDALEGVVAPAAGGAPPRVRIESIEVELARGRSKSDAPHYEVMLDLRIQAVDDLVVASTMLESFRAKMDEHNGALDVRIGKLHIDPLTKTLSVPRLLIELPAPEGPPTLRSSREALVEITRGLSADTSLISALRIKPSERRAKSKHAEDYLDLQLGKDDPHLTVESCGGFLQRLTEKGSAFPITHLSLRRNKKEDGAAGGWSLEAALQVSRTDS